MTTLELRTQVRTGAVAAALAGLAFASYPLGAAGAIAAFLAAVLVVIAAIDISTFRIPNRIVLPSAAIVLAANIAFSPGRAIEYVLAALLAGVVLVIPNLIRSSWMGMGDVKLGMLLGAALGWAVVGALEIAFISLLPFALVVRARGGREARTAALPFGPFMAFGALAVLIVPHIAGLGG
jgi:prepilin signal peptidase PulO-like enzyme (type II secretory pathway)